jgi:PPP family 3-phenylpropionic acid transporter
MRRQFWVFFLFYFFYWAAAASLTPYLSLHFSHLSLSGIQIGSLLSLPALVVFLSSIFLGFVADLTKRQDWIVKTCLFGLVLSAILLSRGTTFFGLLPIVILYSFFSAPVNPLIDQNVIGEYKETPWIYSRARIGGSIGYGAIVFVTGVISMSFGLNQIFLIYVFLMILCLLLLFQFPASRSELDRYIHKDFIKSMSQKTTVNFFFLLLLWSIGEATTIYYLFLFIEDLGGNYALMGLSVSSAIISEIMGFLISGRLLRKIQLRQILFISLLIQFIRLSSLSMIQSPILVLPIQFIGGISFALVLSSSVTYVDRLSSQRSGSSLQSIRSGIQFGLGYSIGAILGGIANDLVGYRMTFRLISLILLFGIVYLVLNKRALPALNSSYEIAD